MTDPRALISEIARLTKERDDYAEICRDFFAIESPQASVTLGEDRDHWFKWCTRHEREIASLKADLAAAEEATRKALEAIPIAMDAAVEKEREACAKIADKFDLTITRRKDDDVISLTHRGIKLAAAIRARTPEAK